MHGYETVDVGPMKSEDQSFWEITDHKIDVLDHAKFSAIVGIGPGHPPSNTEKTLLMSYGVDEFSICLERKSGRPGWLTWGSIATDQEREKSFASAPVIGKIHW